MNNKNPDKLDAEFIEQIHLMIDEIKKSPVELQVYYERLILAALTGKVTK